MMTVHLSAKASASFPEALAALTAQAHVTCVAEGMPMKPTLTPAQAAVCAGDLPLDTAAAKLADAYDYDVKRTRNVFTFKKRYTDPHDLPGITLEESLRALTDLQDIVGDFNPGVPPERVDQTQPLIVDLAPSLSPEQLTLMQQQGLPVASLTPQQQSWVRNIALYMYVQMPAEAIKGFLDQLSQMPKAVLRQTNDAGKADFGYEVGDYYYRRPMFVSFAANAGGIYGSSGSSTLSPTTVASPPPSEANTLGQAVLGLKARGASVAVEPALQEKPITLTGLDQAPSDAILNALAGVYGLYVHTGSDGKKSILRPLLQKPSDVASLPTLVRQALPEPMLRALHGDTLYDLQQQVSQPAPSAPDPKWVQHLQDSTAEISRLTGVPATIRAQAVARLRTLTAAKLAQAGPTGRVPVSTLSEPARQALAVAVMALALQRAVQAWPSEPPGYIRHFDQVSLTGGPYQDQKGQSRYTLNLLTPDPISGSLQSDAGMSNMPYHPN